MSAEESIQLSKEIFNIFNAKVTDILTTVSNTPMEVKMGEVLPGEELDAATLEDKIKVEITLSNFLDGKIYYVIEKKIVARLADLMMMGDGSAEYEADHDEAIAELFNQILGAFITDASAQYEAEISNDSTIASVTKFEDESYGADEYSFFTGTIIMDEFDDFDYTLIFTNSLIDKALSNIEGQIGEAEDLVDEKPAEDPVSFDDVLGQFEFDEPEESNKEELANLETNDENDDVTKDLENIYDISLDVAIELGKTRMSIRKMLALTAGSIIELDKLAGEPVDILVNQKLIAKGEVVVIDESFGVRLTTLVSPEDRIKSMS